MNKKIKIALYSGLIGLVSGIYIWGIPAIVNISGNKPFIEQKILENSGYKVSLGNPELSMGLFPSVWIKSDKISLLNDDGTEALTVSNPKVKINLFPLLRKKLVISYLTAEKENVHLFYTKNSEFLLGQYPIKLPEKSGELSLFKLNLDLGEYNITLDDQKNNKRLSLDGEYIKNGKYIQNKSVELSTKGELNAGGKSTDIYADIDIDLPINRLSEDKFKLNAEIKDFDLSTISDYSNTLTKGYIKSLSGIINILADTKTDDFGHKDTSINISTNGLEIIGQEKATSIIFKDKLTANLDFSTVENGLNIKDFSLEGKNIHAKADGKLYKIGSPELNYDINAQVKDTRTEDVISILPGSETLLPDFNLYKLKKYIFYADGNGKLNFKGKGRFPKVNGYVKLRNAYLIHPMKGADANATIDLDFKNQEMMLDVFVPAAGKNQSVSVTGKALIDGTKYAELNIKSTNAVNLAPAQEVLNPLHEILKFQLGPVPMMKIEGIGNIDMRSAGRKIDPHIWGKINFSNATASFIDVNNLVLHNGAGEVNFDDTKVTFKTHSATVNGKPIEIKGDCVMLGKLNVYVTSKGQDIQKLIKTINSSPILKEVQRVVKPFTKPSGIADVYLHIYGKVKENAEEVVFNEDLFAKGKITFHNGSTQLQDTFLPLTKINGVVNFDKYDCDYDVTGFARNSKAHVWGTGANNTIDLKAQSDKFELNDVFDILHSNMPIPFKKELGKLKASFNASYKGKIVGNQLDYNKIIAEGKFISNISSKDVIRVNGGTFNIKNGYLKTSSLNGLFNDNPFNLSFTTKDLNKEMMNIVDAKFNFKDFDISSINSIKNQIAISKNTSRILDNIAELNGRIDIIGNIKNNKINADTKIDGITFKYVPTDGIVRVIDGRANIRDSVLYLDKISSRLSSMPVFLDGKISNIFSNNPNINLYISSKLTQQFFDRFFNSKFVYPVKTKGEINFHTNLNGKLNSFKANSTLNIGEDASIYYMGATLQGAPTGNINTEGIASTNPISIVSDIDISPNRIKINSFDYYQTIISQNKKKSLQKQLTANGELSLLKNNIVKFKNLKIKTKNPTNARIFNVLFKKPTIKQGVFTSDLTINGTSNEPAVLGDLNIKSIDIPLFDATVQDVNLDFKPDYVNLNSTGLILTNDIIVNAKIVNSLSKPIKVENFNVQMEELNLNRITDALNEYEADSTRSSKLKSGEVSQILPSNTVIIKEGIIKADKILIKNATAKDFQSHLTLDNDEILHIDNFGFKIANGKVSGDIRYNLQDLNGSINVKIKDTDAQIIADDFFEMPGQIYGNVSGRFSAKCHGLSSLECLNTLSADGTFEVKDGKMPKLGSLEYLLKAGNLITGGVTGVSINGIIDLITPLKTGQFSSIKGDVKINNGIAENINVYSSGNDLSMYMTGSYNLSTLVADMEIYGSLSKNFSTILGKISNASLNTLFNTIPGVKINDINPKSTSNIRKIPNFEKDNVLRVFKAEIYGDINGNNYVKSFKWIKE